MNYTEALSRYVAAFVDELAQHELGNVVISPGSRSTPLAMTFAEHPDVKTWVNMDERSAGFFALGIAKQTNQPVALVCTSGTAAANYYPAVIEAYYSRVPLLVLTADRPHELRDVGAPQAINQLHLYGEYAKWFQELSLPEATDRSLGYIRSIAARAFHVANGKNKGVVHLNFPFREPLVPDFSLPNLWGNQEKAKHLEFHQGQKQLSTPELHKLYEQLKQYKKGLIVCGPMQDNDAQVELLALAEAWQIPILADPLSQLRQGVTNKRVVIDSYDAILKDPNTRKKLEPDFIIRFGAMPVSKPYTLWLKEKPAIDHYVVEEDQGFREPVGHGATVFYTDPAMFCATMLELPKFQFDLNWVKQWQSYNQVAMNILKEHDEEGLNEGHAVVHLAEHIPDNSTLFIGNSMAIRDVDTFWFATNKIIKMLANRGANGIDGVISSALGAATASKRVTLFIGDVSFFHDQNGLLMAKQYGLNLTIVLINNNGGGIFSFLPQAKQQSPHYEALFGTPLDLDLSHVAQLYKGNYANPKTWEAYQEALKESYRRSGLSIIELNTVRTHNAAWHEQKWRKIATHIEEELHVSDGK
ncbi:2-succinyl-5-enolpyruvyl-6-hydroxy-3-cyclohexene-1-carboxylic-acid synthase [Paraliobacillus ryukyuensis]|uniref:2-succinyl-5-enolpyruvyl-6-hydroxy-3- cyclohexene-1-carboxylic-acid synthase n=1 Tax=Paraliobacillus ryukyuensis TaxID=200904 RepID=UPI0009A85D0E|nr:2-succinyl-5-enolpyruvyl-6-hydroxy-3-cyclohexene-1-carboxylic-acid synthase [Paraliobacillus ryukyuensis]